MREDSKKLKRAFSFAQEGIRKFAYTDLYILLVLAIVVAAWIWQNATFGFVTLILVSCAVLVFSDDLLPLSVNAFGAMLMIFKVEGESVVDISRFLFLWPTLIPLVVAILVFVVRNTVAKVRGKQRFVLGKMFFPQVAVSAALLLGGVGTIAAKNYLTALPNVIALGIGVLAVYLLFANFIKIDENRDYAKYFAKVVMWIGFAVCIEMIVHISRLDISSQDWSKWYWDLGWGNRNNIATFLLFSAPMATYLSTRTRKGWAYIVMALFQYACLVMTLSRGGILFGAIAAVFGVVFSILKAPNRKTQATIWGVAILAALVICLVKLDLVKGIVSSLADRIESGGNGDVTSGRFDLYKEAWEQFVSHPIFGAGMGFIGTRDGQFHSENMSQYWFHSTLFQVLGCMGIFGIAAYAYYYVVRFGIVFKGMKKNCKFAFFVFVAWLGFEGYSMIDTGTMIPFPNMMLVAVMSYIAQLANLQRSESDIDGVPNSLLNEVYVRDTGIDVVRVKLIINN